MRASHSSTVCDIVMPAAIASASRLLNQQRIQLSFAYCTTSRNGGEVTVNCTLFDSICLVAAAAPVKNCAESAAALSRQRSAAEMPPCNCIDLRKIKARTSLY